MVPLSNSTFLVCLYIYPLVSLRNPKTIHAHSSVLSLMHAGAILCLGANLAVAIQMSLIGEARHKLNLDPINTIAFSSILVCAFTKYLQPHGDVTKQATTTHTQTHKNALLLVYSVAVDPICLRMLTTRRFVCSSRHVSSSRASTKLSQSLLQNT